MQLIACIRLASLLYMAALYLFARTRRRALLNTLLVVGLMPFAMAHALCALQHPGLSRATCGGDGAIALVILQVLCFYGAIRIHAARGHNWLGVGAASIVYGYSAIGGLLAFAAVAMIGA